MFIKYRWFILLSVRERNTHLRHEPVSANDEFTVENFLTKYVPLAVAFQFEQSDAFNVGLKLKIYLHTALDKPKFLCDFFSSLENSFRSSFHVHFSSFLFPSFILE